MSARTRLPRQAAQVAKYTFDEPSDDEPEDPRGANSSDDEDARPAKKRKKGKAKAAGKKGRLAVHQDEEEEEQDSTTKHIRVQSPPPKDVEYKIKRVDFSKVLPVEIVAEIFSYLQPRTLYGLAFLNRSFHTMLSSPGFRSTWRDVFTWHDPRMDWMDDVFFGFDEEEQPEQKKTKPKPRDDMPSFEGEEIDPYRLAVLLYETTCEFCGKNAVKFPDTFLLLRLCADCRRNNLVSSTALAESKKYDGMHPATIRAVLSSPFGIEDFKKYVHERNVLVTHFYQTIDELEELQAEDDADQQTANAELAGHATGRNPSRAAKVKAFSRARAQINDDEAAEDERNGPRVAAFLEARASERVARHAFVNAVDKLAAKVDRFCEDEVVEGRLFSMQAKSMRLEDIRQRLADEGIFELRQINDIRLGRHPAISKDEPLDDHVWAAISESVYADVGRDVAKQLVWKYENKRKEVDWHAAKTSVDLLKQPSSVSDAGWAYVEPAMKQLIQHKKDESDRLAARQRDTEELAEKQKVVNRKNAFFRERYDKVCRMLPNNGARAYMPRFLEFLRLPTVSDLYADDLYGVDPKRAEADVQRFTNHLDAVKVELDDFALELRLAGLKGILASTTEMTANEIEDLEIETLADPQYGDKFFERPSSWLFCGGCIVFGTLSALLQHIHKKHPRNPPPLRLEDEAGDAAQRKPPTKPLVRLPLEVACAWSAIFELGKLDIEEPKVTDKDLDRALDEYKLVWENGPRGSKGRLDWQGLLHSVMRNTLLAESKGEVLEPPVIALKDMTPRERRIAEEARKAANLARMAKKLKREGKKKKAAEPSGAKVKVEQVEPEEEDERKLGGAAEHDGESKAQADVNEEPSKEEDEAGANEESEPDEAEEQGEAGAGSRVEEQEESKVRRTGMSEGIRRSACRRL